MDNTQPAPKRAARQSRACWIEELCAGRLCGRSDEVLLSSERPHAATAWRAIHPAPGTRGPPTAPTRARKRAPARRRCARQRRPRPTERRGYAQRGCRRRGYGPRHHCECGRPHARARGHTAPRPDIGGHAPTAAQRSDGPAAAQPPAAKPQPRQRTAQKTGRLRITQALASYPNCNPTLFPHERPPHP